MDITLSFKGISNRIAHKILSWGRKCLIQSFSTFDDLVDLTYTVP